MVFVVLLTCRKLREARPRRNTRPRNQDAPAHRPQDQHAAASCDTRPRIQPRKPVSLKKKKRDPATLPTPLLSQISHAAAHHHSSQTPLTNPSRRTHSSTIPLPHIPFHNHPHAVAAFHRHAQPASSPSSRVTNRPHYQAASSHPSSPATDGPSRLHKDPARGRLGKPRRDRGVKTREGDAKAPHAAAHPTHATAPLNQRIREDDASHAAAQRIHAPAPVTRPRITRHAPACSSQETRPFSYATASLWHAPARSLQRGIPSTHSPSRPTLTSTSNQKTQTNP